jgi:serralysin
MSYPWCVLCAPKVPGKSRAALLLDAAWPVNSVITVSFLDGPALLRPRILNVAQQWIDRTGIGLSFEYRTDTVDTDIRISCKYAGSWSLLGRYARSEPDKSQPTMNYGWLNEGSTDLEVQEVVLHEFGHALGLIHEHQNPEAHIPWNREVVIQELSGPPNNWDRETIERNVFQGYDRHEVRTTPFDEKSIMLYPVNPAWTIGGYSTTNNTSLSDKDIELIKEIYL